MANQGIQDLVPFKGPFSITVRVIRKYSVQWNPREKRKLFYLLADAHGRAIEAKVETRKKRLDSQVFLYRCYRVDGYVLDPPMGFYQVVDAPATMVIGDRTVFQPVDADDNPKQHFNFISNADLKEKSEQTVFLIDYLCRIENCSAIMKRKENNMLKMWVIDESEKVIEITLWENIAYTYANVVAAGKVVAVSSLKITKFQENLQLESTSATTIDVDLAIEGYSDRVKRLKDLPKKGCTSFGFQTETDIRSNVVTLADVLSKDAGSIHNHRFACIAAIKEIHGYRTWYSTRCPNSQCNDTVRYEDGRLICKHCGDVEKPVYKYCVNATLCSDKSSLPVVFFDSSMAQILGTDCETLVVREGYTDSKVVPKPMLSLIGKEKIFSFTIRQNDDAHIHQTLDVKGAVSDIPGTLPVNKDNSTALLTPAAKIPSKHRRSEDDVDDVAISNKKA